MTYSLEQIDQAIKRLSQREYEAPSMMKELLLALRMAEARLRLIEKALDAEDDGDGEIYGSQEEACTACRDDIRRHLPTEEEWTFSAEEALNPVRIRHD
jgi:hypothetical protein